MRIYTWNVNGLRAVINKGALGWLETHRPDILCLQEIKTRADQLTETQKAVFKDYQPIWNPAERPGYSGVATFLSEAPGEYQVGMGEALFDGEGRVIKTCHPGFSLFNVYFPSGQRGYERVSYKLDFYARLLEIIDAHHAAGESVVVCGDFNTAHTEMDLKNPKQNQTTSGFLPEERVWIDRYLAHGLVDAFRALNPDRVQYTWWTYRLGARERNIGWRLDYFLVSEALMPKVQGIMIHDDLPGSDHCPVSMRLES